MKNLYTFTLILYVLFAFHAKASANAPLNLCPMDSNSDINFPESDTALANHLTSYAAYNVWANKEFSNWLSGLSEDLAQKEMVSSFPTIRETLFHLYNAEHGWFSWVKTGEWQSADESWKDLSTADLWEKLCEKSEEILAHVEDWNDSDWQVVLKRSNGLEMTRAQVFQTVFNHATYHRGQCITMGRQLGLTDPPRTDYVYFISLK